MSGDTPLWLEAGAVDAVRLRRRRAVPRGHPRPGRLDSARPADGAAVRPARQALALLLDDEVHLRAGELLHRVSLRHGGTITEPASW